MKAHSHDRGGDSFADMLAATDDDTAASAQTPTPVAAPQTNAAAAPNAQAANQVTEEMPDDAPADPAAPATASLNLAAVLPPASKPQATPSEKDVSDKDKAKPQDIPPANDNAAAQAMVQPLPVPPPATAKAAPQDGSAAAVAATGTASAPAAAQPPAQDAEAGETDDNAEIGAAAPQAGQTAAKGVTPKAAKPATDIKKAADGAKPAAAKTEIASAQNKSADAKQADVKAADAQQAGARPTETPAPAAPQNNGPQDALAPVAAPAPANANTPAAIATAQPAAAPMPHHAPTLNGLAVEIAAKSQAGTKQFDIRLDPPELGRVDVRLAIDANGKTQAHLTADQPQTLDLLQKDAATLTRALRDAGLDVSHDGLNFSLRNQQQQSGHDQSNGQGGRSWRGSFTAPAPIETANVANAYSARGLGLLDIKV
jgi:flagellar hook-length control protein FliK